MSCGCFLVLVRTQCVPSLATRVVAKIYGFTQAHIFCESGLLENEPTAPAEHTRKRTHSILGISFVFCFIHHSVATRHPHSQITVYRRATTRLGPRLILVYYPFFTPREPILPCHFYLPAPPPAPPGTCPPQPCAQPVALPPSQSGT